MKSAALEARVETGCFDYRSDSLAGLPAFEIGDALESGAIIRFLACPFRLPASEDLALLRAQLPVQLEAKNVSYHPESDSVHGVAAGTPLHALAYRVLKEHSVAVEGFLARCIGHLMGGCRVATSSFRPIQERGRNLKPHASNELLHVDAGAYGATNGDRILRVFVNVNEQEDRVWATKGTFRRIYERHALAAGIAGARSLHKRPLDHLRTSILRAARAAGLEEALIVDSSPYDRLMRRFHNYMKDTSAFQARDADYQEIRFAPGCAWMVFTDSVTHASIAGQHALVNTFIVPLANCRKQSVAPFNILQSGRAA